MPEPWELVIVDAFTDRPFHGNPAAVLVLSRGGELSSRAMQALAAELNLSETAISVRQDGPWGLRWFTPKAEVDLCGHATMATGAVILNGEDRERVEFETRSGLLAVTRDGDRFAMDFPSRPAVRCEPAVGLLEALGLAGTEVVAVGRNVDDYLVEVPDGDALAAVRPDFTRLGMVDTRGVAVAALGRDGVDVVSRFFAPAVGVDEDPVTGSAHTMLGPWFRDRIGDRLVCRQLSERGGELWLECRGERMSIAGHATEVARYSLQEHVVEALTSLDG